MYDLGIIHIQYCGMCHSKEQPALYHTYVQYVPTVHSVTPH